MAGIHEITVEILREGQAHNQLLSQFTRYLAICGDASPATIGFDVEHRKLLDRLEHLRYLETREASRQSAVHELGEISGGFLRKIRALDKELSSSESADADVVHLRLVLFGSELGLVPFELAALGEGSVGEGLPLLLQMETPVTLTREARRRRPVPVNWARKPRVLFVSAEPAGMTVPSRAHLGALRRALEPWIKWEKTPEARLKHVHENLSALTGASLDAIRDACLAGVREDRPFTHVHILAHGIPFEEAGELRYGLALSSRRDPSTIDRVTGRQIAIALRQDRRGPSVVTLMTCDSGNQASVLTPGGSIAHELHAFGIPWVIASQFPLTKSGSVSVALSLYAGLLRGEDPRLVLQAVRQSLYGRAQSDHDWASLVAYATLPPDFERQVLALHDLQLRRALDVAFDKAEKDWSGDDALAERVQALDHRLFGLSGVDGLAARAERSEWIGMKAASEKRRAEILYKRDQPKKELAAMRSARSLYERALAADLNNHWVAMQFLSLSVVLGEKVEDFWWGLVRYNARKGLQMDKSLDRAWAHGTLAELEMLGIVQTPNRLEEIQRTVEEHCRAIVQLTGKDSFAVFSTSRQFTRYLKWWKREEWRPIAQTAIKALTA